MKKLLLSSLAVLAFAGSSAFAADLRMPVKAPIAPPPPVATWTGCYINGGIGYGFFNQEEYSVVGVPQTAFTATTNGGGEGWLGRVGAGCDYEVASKWVIGVFGDYDFADIHGTVAGFNTTAMGLQRENSAWAVGGRIGYVVTPSLLTYVNGGYTQARFDRSEVLTNSVPAVDIGLDVSAHTYSGWFIGGGVEYSLSSVLPLPGLFWRTEYRYARYQGDFVSVTADPGFVAAAGAAEHIRPDVQTVTSGLVWRFNFGR
jgi:outer membrane immunogenic protein